MTDMHSVITENIDVWTGAIKKRNTTGRGISKKIELSGVKKLRELILELAVRGELIPQNSEDEPASVLLENIAKEKAILLKEKKIKKSKILPAISSEEKIFDLPNGWEWVRLQDICSYIQRGKGPKYDELGKVKVVSQKCIQWSGFNIEPARSVNNVSLEKYQPERYLQSRDLLWNSTGTGTVGRINVLEYVEERSLVADSHVTVIRTMLVDCAFIKNYISAPGVQLRIEPDHENALVSGSTKQVELNTSVVMSLEIPIPPLAEQHRIVAKVDELMALCDQLEQQTEDSIAAHKTLVETLLGALTNSADAKEFNESWKRIAQHFDILFTTEDSIDQLKQTILQLAVMGKLVPQDPNDEPASVLLDKIAKEKERLIAEGKIKKGRSSDTIIRENCNWNCHASWSEIELQDLFRFIDYRGKNPKKSESGIRLITAKNIRNGFLKNDPVEYISNELYKTWMVRGFPQNSDILFVTEGHTMGFVYLVNLEYKFALAQRTICFQPFEKINTQFFLYLFMSTQFQKIVKDNETGSAAGGIKASKLKRLPVPIPSLEEQNRIVKKVEGLFALCDQLKSQLSDAQTTQLHLADAIVERAI